MPVQYLLCEIRRNKLAVQRMLHKHVAVVLKPVAVLLHLSVQLLDNCHVLGRTPQSPALPQLLAVEDYLPCIGELACHLATSSIQQPSFLTPSCQCSLVWGAIC